MLNFSNASMFFLLAAVSLVAWAFYVKSNELTLDEVTSPAQDGQQDMADVYTKQQALFVTAGVLCALASLMMLPSLCSGGVSMQNASQWGGFLAGGAATLVIFSLFYEAQGSTAAHSGSYNGKTTSALQAVGGSMAAASALLAAGSILPASFIGQ